MLENEDIERVIYSEPPELNIEIDGLELEVKSMENRFYQTTLDLTEWTILWKKHQFDNMHYAI